MKDHAGHNHEKRSSTGMRSAAAALVPFGPGNAAPHVPNPVWSRRNEGHRMKMSAPVGDPLSTANALTPHLPVSSHSAPQSAESSRAGLQTVTSAWEKLPSAIQKAILGLVESQK